MRRFLNSLVLLPLSLLFAFPALAGKWGENWGSMIWGSVAAVPSMEGIGVWVLVISLLGATVWRLRRRTTPAGLMLVLLLLVPLLMAPHYTNWNAFTNGEVADADAVNQNFQLAAAALDDFEARVSALEATISGLEAEIDAQAVLIAELQNSNIQRVGAYLQVDESTSTLILNGNMIPSNHGVWQLGSGDKRWSHVFQGQSLTGPAGETASE